MKVERVVTSGIFSLDGEDFEVENNIWLVGDDEAVVVDATGLQTLFSADTLFKGGPGATGRSFSSRPTPLRSIEAERAIWAPE